VVAETEKVQLQRLALHHFLRRNVGYIYRSEVRLTGNGAKTGKFRTVELYKVVSVRVLVRESFQNLRGVVLGIGRIIVSAG